MGAQRFGLYGVKIGSTLVGGITEQSVFAGSVVRAEATSGMVYPQHIALTAQNPTASFTTRALTSLLTAFAAETNHEPFLGVPGTGGVVFAGEKHLDEGARAAAAAHYTLTINHGILALGTLRVDHGGDATLSVMVTVGYDGTNEPLIPSATATLAALATDAERFTLGTVQIGGVTLTSVVGWDLDFGVRVEAVSVDGDIWPTLVSVVEVNPRLTLRGVDLAWLKSSGAIPLSGVAAAHADTILKLRKREVGGTFQGDVPPEHIQLTLAGMATVEQPMSGNPLENNVVLVARHDGTNNPVQFDLSATA